MWRKIWVKLITRPLILTAIGIILSFSIFHVSTLIFKFEHSHVGYIFSIGMPTLIMFPLGLFIKKYYTLLLKQKEDLKDLGEMKDILLSVLSHDIKGPLGTINKLIELLNNENISEEELVNVLRKMSIQVDETISLADNLIEWVKLQNAGLISSKEIFSLDQLIEENIRLFSIGASLKGVSLEYNSKEGFQVFADRQQINIVVRNLIANAIKFTPVSTKINIQTISLGDKIEVKVSDEGIGLDNRIFKSIFEKGITKSLVGTDKEKGTGIGLLLCHHFIENNEGEIFLKSENTVGTQISFTLKKSSQ